MSSSFPHHLHPISLDNYEEYFLLYTDGELSAAQVAAVEAFVAQHPTLQAELDLLLSTRLPLEETHFPKESLLAEAMPEGSAQQDLLLYLDNELPEAKAKVVALELAANPSYQAQYDQWMQTKLDPAEHIVHPNKASLYRQEVKRIGLPAWLRIAAAVMLLAGGA